MTEARDVTGVPGAVLHGSFFRAAISAECARAYSAWLETINVLAEARAAHEALIALNDGVDTTNADELADRRQKTANEVRAFNEWFGLTPYKAHAHFKREQELARVARIATTRR